MLGGTVYINGDFFSEKDARISVFDHGFVYGDGVFEGIQIVSGGIFKLDEHIDRLYKSAHYVEIPIPLTPAEFRNAIIDLCRRNNIADGYIRPIVTRGAGPMGIRNMDQLGPTSIVIITQNEGKPGRRDIARAERQAQISAIRRIPRECLDPGVKTCNYLNNILAYLQAKHAGVSSAIMLDMNGFVAEGYASNIFAVRNGEVWTPTEGSILRGITRDTIRQICRDSSIPYSERQLTVYDLVNAEEVFETASMLEIVPITTIDGKRVGSGKSGPITQKLYTALRSLMESGTSSTPIFARQDTNVHG